MVKRSQSQVTFHVSESIFHSRERDIQLPKLLVGHVDGTAQMVTSMQLSVLSPARERPLPHLFVLHSDGKLLHSQGTAALKKDASYSEKAVVDFLSKWIPTQGLVY